MVGITLDTINQHCSMVAHSVCGNVLFWPWYCAVTCCPQWTPLQVSGC